MYHHTNPSGSHWHIFLGPSEVIRINLVLKHGLLSEHPFGNDVWAIPSHHDNSVAVPNLSPFFPWMWHLNSDYQQGQDIFQWPQTRYHSPWDSGMEPSYPSADSSLTSFGISIQYGRQKTRCELYLHLRESLCPHMHVSVKGEWGLSLFSETGELS